MHTMGPASCRVGERTTARAQRRREGSPRNEDDSSNARMAIADHDRQEQAAQRRYKSRIVFR